MPIDPSVLKRDAQANIADWAVTIRHREKEIQAHLNATADALDPLMGGLLDDMQMTLVVIGADFVADPQPRDLLEIRMRDGSWREFEIQKIPDLYDPLAPTTTLIVGNPAK